jgi:uncharacterized membrane protein
MTAEVLVYIGGAYQLVWALSHLMFPKLLKWETALAPMDDFNRYLMLIFSKLLLFFYLGTALICFIYARELPDTDTGLAVLIFLSLYWLVRAILQVQHFGFKKADMMNVKMSTSNTSNQTISYILFIMFLVGCGLYLAPVLVTKL